MEKIVEMHDHHSYVLKFKSTTFENKEKNAWLLN